MHYINNAPLRILLFNILYVLAFIKIMYYECWNKQIEENKLSLRNSIPADVFPTRTRHLKVISTNNYIQWYCCLIVIFICLILLNSAPSPPHSYCVECQIVQWLEYVTANPQILVQMPVLPTDEGYFPKKSPLKRSFCLKCDVFIIPWLIY